MDFITSVALGKTWTDAEVRSLRDQVYGIPISDAEWCNVRFNWMRPDSIEFLHSCLTRNKLAENLG
jgi:hypothetical protein